MFTASDSGITDIRIYHPTEIQDLFKDNMKQTSIGTSWPLQIHFRPVSIGNNILFDKKHGLISVQCFESGSFIQLFPFRNAYSNYKCLGWRSSYVFSKEIQMKPIHKEFGAIMFDEDQLMLIGGRHNQYNLPLKQVKLVNLEI